MAFELKFLPGNIAVVFGVTDGSANTGLSTLPPNPFGHSGVFAMAFGEGVYVEDDGSTAPRQSGVTASGIDVRSSVTSARFVCIVVQLTPGEGLVRDHSAVTT